MKPQPRFPEPSPQCGFETICNHFAEAPARYEGAVSPPIYQTSTFAYPDAAAFAARREGPARQHDYTRVSNPTKTILEAKLARLERAAWAETFGSGMGAITAAINACITKDAHIVSVEHVYGPTRSYFKHLRRFGVETTYVGGTDPQSFADALRPNTALLYLESPTTGYFELLDLPEVTRPARERGIPVLFDNSWASPYFQQPLDLGVDLVLHSATKYLNGHSDVVAGVVAGRSRELQEKVWAEIELCGACLDPFAAWLMIRGLRTLALRMDAHQHKGLAVARALADHPHVARVHHPGLATHPQHALAARQLSGYASLFSFELKEQTRAATHHFIDRLKLFTIGVSWGGHESLALGGTFFGADPLNPTWLIRLHVGLESADDLVRDVLQALED